MHGQPSFHLKATHKKLKCDLAHRLDWLSDDRNRRGEKSGEWKIVDTDDGHVARIREVYRLHRSHRRDEQPAARSKNRSGFGQLGKNGVAGFESFLLAERPTDNQPPVYRDMTGFERPQKPVSTLGGHSEEKIGVMLVGTSSLPVVCQPARSNSRTA